MLVFREIFLPYLMDGPYPRTRCKLQSFIKRFKYFVCDRPSSLIFLDKRKLVDASVHRFKKTGFFSIWIFFHEYSRLIGQQWNGEAISLSSLYHFHPLHRHLDISRTITAESSPLHITSSRTGTRKLLFQSASR